MNKWVIGAIALAVSCCGIGLFVVANGLGSSVKVAKSAQTFTNRELPLILKNWDAQRLFDLSADDLKSSSPLADTKKTFDQFRNDLGPLVTYRDALLRGLNATSNTQKGSSVVTSLEADCDFKKVPAVISIKLLRVGDSWKFADFRVEPQTAVGGEPPVTTDKPAEAATAKSSP
ncbi:MAG: hypothetical protein JNM85_02060 [Chthonomonas sp.]|nr:hypothetical protein [Chthonomonas sp.]